MDVLVKPCQLTELSYHIDAICMSALLVDR